jgi:extracellular factor (EF) 3-hydroxypalmitic acid methyl ester biosynthesis protein
MSRSAVRQRFAVSIESGKQLLDRTVEGIEVGAIAHAMRSLITGLHQMESASEEVFARFVREVAPAHRLSEILAADPFTARARSKPRGYAADPVLIDYVYDGLDPAFAFRATPLGRAIFRETALHSITARAIRMRRDLLCAHLGAVGRKKNKARVLAVGAGHLREARSDFGLAELIALDDDPESLAMLRKSPVIRPLEARTKALLDPEWGPRDLDFIYVPALLDYFSDDLVAELTQRLFERLKPGGELLVSNFVPGFAMHGYQRAFMSWPLICRTPRELMAFLDHDQVTRRSSWCDVLGCIAYAWSERRA